MTTNPRYRGEHVYVVYWPDHLIVKAGYTSQSRWRGFMGRGAHVHQLTMFDDCHAALTYEQTLHDYFYRRAPWAFASKEESRGLLGPLGGNCETYQLANWETMYGLPPPSPDHVIESPRLSYNLRPVGA